MPLINFNKLGDFTNLFNSSTLYICLYSGKVIPDIYEIRIGYYGGLQLGKTYSTSLVWP